LKTFVPMLSDSAGRGPSTDVVPNSESALLTLRQKPERAGAVALPPWLIDGCLIVGRAGDVHFLCHLVMARLAHAIWFRCEVVALTRLVTVRLCWALTLHCFGSCYGRASVPKSPSLLGCIPPAHVLQPRARCGALARDRAARRCDSQMLTWMCRPASVIGGKADMTLTSQYVR